ncbi:MAG: hypothetical protein V3V97_15765 [Hyphomicrobiaceae bacterium]
MYYWPFKDAAVARRFSEGILKAGLPDASGRYYQVTEVDRLNGEQIAGLVFGRTISGYGLWDDKRWWREFGRDGDVFWRGPPVKEVPWYGPSVEADSGFARVKGDRLCEKWEKMNEGYETCFPVFRYPRGTPGGRDDYLFVTDTGIYPWSLSE